MADRDDAHTTTVPEPGAPRREPRRDVQRVLGRGLPPRKGRGDAGADRPKVSSEVAPGVPRSGGARSH